MRGLLDIPLTGDCIVLLEDFPWEAIVGRQETDQGRIDVCGTDTELESGPLVKSWTKVYTVAKDSVFKMVLTSLYPTHYCHVLVL